MTAIPKKRPAASHTQGNVKKRPAGAARNPAAAAPARSDGAHLGALRVLLATWLKSIPVSILQRRLLDLSFLPRVEFLRRESMSEVLLRDLPMHARSAPPLTPNFNVVVF